MSYQSIILADTPIGYWRMGSTANAYNEVTAVNDTLIGTPSATVGAAGSTGWTLGAAGATYINLGAGYTEFAADGTWSIEGWFRHGLVNTQSEHMYIRLPTVGGVIGGTAPADYHKIAIRMGALGPGNIHVEVYSSGVKSVEKELNGPYSTSGLPSMNDSKWHHIVIVGGGIGVSSNSKIYLDGVMLFSWTAQSMDFGGISTYHKIGGSEYAYDSEYRYWGKFSGGAGADLDEWAIYNYALTSTQVAAHYNAAVHANLTVTATRTVTADIASMHADRAITASLTAAANLLASRAVASITASLTAAAAVTSIRAIAAITAFRPVSAIRTPVSLLNVSVQVNGNGVQLQVTPPATPPNHYEIYRSVSDKFWRYSYTNTAVVSNVTYMRVYRQLNGAGATSINVTDQGVESGVTYTYFIRAMGSDLVSYTDSTLYNVTCTLEHTWITPVVQAVGVASPVNCEFRYANPGLSETPDLENTTLLFAGRAWPVTDYGLHQSSVLSVVIDLPYGENAAGYGDEAVLRKYAMDGTMLVYRDRRGRKAYGRIDGLKFADAQWGKTAAFSFQSLDIDSSI